jgi:hypothetical protein
VYDCDSSLLWNQFLLIPKILNIFLRIIPITQRCLWWEGTDKTPHKPLTSVSTPKAFARLIIPFILFYTFCPERGCNHFIPFCYCVAMGGIPQKWIFACVNCGCIFTTMAEKQTGICPVCKSSDRNTIEGFIY